MVFHMEKNKLYYQITFLSDWHAGSGLTSGAGADAVVMKDADHLPFLPGKTIKGLLKDAVIDMYEVQPSIVDKDMIKSMFGFEKEDGSTAPGSLFFSNAVLPDDERKMITDDLSHYLFRNISSTAIADTGIAKPGSLRTIEVTVPVILEGYISSGTDISDEMRKLLKIGMQWTRHAGTHRNRGLGRCRIQLVSK